MNDQDFQGNRPESAPLVGRPRGVAWRNLQADGVVWEGQVVIHGDEADLAARAIITHRRVVFVRGGDIVLDISRGWLRPAPFLKRDGSIVLNISPPGAHYGEPPVSLTLHMRDGHPAAGYMVSMLAGSGARQLPSEIDAIESTVRSNLPPVREDPWVTSRAMARELTADQPSAPPIPNPPPAKPTWTARPPDGDIGQSLLAAASARTDPEPRRELVLRQPSGPVASGQNRDWNIATHPISPRSQRRSRWGWALRITGLVGLLALAAGFGAGRLPSPLDTGRSTDGLPVIASSANGRTTANSRVLQEAAQQTAVALGVGGVERLAAPALINTTTDGIPVIDPSGTNAAWLAPTAAAPAPAVLEPLPTEPAALAQQESASTPTPTPEPSPTPAPSPTATAVAAVVASPDSLAASPVATPATPAPVATVVPASEQDRATPEASNNSAPIATPEPVTATSATPITEAPFNYTVRLAEGGATLPAFGLAPSTAGNWLVAIVDVENTGEDDVTLPMSSFRLEAGGGEAVILDPGADLAAMIAGISPAWAPSDDVPFAPGESHRLVLLFQIDPSVSDFTLLARDEALPLADALRERGAPADLPALP